MNHQTSVFLRVFLAATLLASVANAGLDNDYSGNDRAESDYMSSGDGEQTQGTDIALGVVFGTLAYAIKAMHHFDLVDKNHHDNFFWLMFDGIFHIELVVLSFIGSKIIDVCCRPVDDYDVGTNQTIALPGGRPVSTEDVYIQDRAEGDVDDHVEADLERGLSFNR